jgi:hypothetical protein
VHPAQEEIRGADNVEPGLVPAEALSEQAMQRDEV